MKFKKKIVAMLMSCMLIMGLCVPAYAAEARRGGRCDSCGVGLMVDFTEYSDVHTAGSNKCTHHKYGEDAIITGILRDGSKCNNCGASYYNGGWRAFSRTECHGFD